MYRYLLVPIDGSDASGEAVGQAVAYAQSMGARLHFLHVRASDGGSSAACEGHALLARGASAARAQGVACDVELVVDDDPVQAVLAALRSAGCDVLFLANDGASAFTCDLLAHAPVPLLVTAANARALATRTVAVIRAEHRALSQVLRAGMAHVQDVKRGVVLDRKRIAAMVQYLHSFAAQQHHPKEDDYLFPMLRTRSPFVLADLDELARQHQRDRLLLAELAKLADHGSVEALDAALAGYAHFLWDHLGREEGVILPAAQRHLQDADWESLHAAFVGEGDARFGSAARLPFAELFDAVVEPPAPVQA
ncbi:MAG: hemerythrin domain-containing protein [Pseudomonadota bacterium]